MEIADWQSRSNMETSSQTNPPTNLALFPNQSVFTESALGLLRSSSRDVYIYIYLSVCLSPFHVIFFGGM